MSTPAYNVLMVGNNVIIQLSTVVVTTWLAWQHHLPLSHLPTTGCKALTYLSYKETIQFIQLRQWILPE